MIVSFCSISLYDVLTNLNTKGIALEKKHYPAESHIDSKLGNIYIVACQRGGVSEKPPRLQAATRHGPFTLLNEKYRPFTL